MTIFTLTGAIQAGQIAVDSPNARIATVSDGWQFYVKSRTWHQWDRPIRLANELFYYALAQERGLPMPVSAIIMLDGVPHWGSQKIAGRDSLTVRDVTIDPTMKSRLKRTFNISSQQRQNLLRCLFLDLLMLNTDRTPWNILGETNGDRVSLAYFDHDRCFGWHGDPNHVIRALDEIPLTSFLKCDPISEMAIRRSSRRECNDLFASLAPCISELDRARSLAPKEWITEAEYESLSCFMCKWWSFVGREFRSRLIYRMIG